MKPVLLAAVLVLASACAHSPAEQSAAGASMVGNAQPAQSPRRPALATVEINDPGRPAWQQVGRTRRDPTVRHYQGGGPISVDIPGRHCFQQGISLVCTE